METSAGFKSEADVVVVGGGLFGCAIAYFLARRNVDVVLIEKNGEVGSEQSTRAWGFVRQQGRDLAELPLMVASNRIWQELPAELGADLEWNHHGILSTANTEDQLDDYRNWMQSAREFGLDTRILSKQEISELIPEMQGPWIGGMYTASDGHAEPTKTTPAFAAAAVRHGATIYTHCSATGFEVTNGAISAVHTDRGTIRTPVAVCSAGAWSKVLARMVGLSLPQLIVRNTVVETAPARHITNLGVGIRGGGVAFRQRAGGTFILGTLERSEYDITLDSVRYAKWFLPNYRANRGLFRMHVGRELVRDLRRSLPGSEQDKHPFAHSVDVEPEPDMNSANRLWLNFGKYLPELKDIKVRRIWAGNIDSTPDAVPVVGDVESPKGFIFATGFSGHGFALGPIVGQLISELIIDGEPYIDISEMNYHRFTAGKEMIGRKVI